MIEQTLEYQLIEEFYGDIVAKRSQVPLINHINEGLVVLAQIGASEYAKRAFCIHPMIQHDLDLENNYEIVVAGDARVVALAMEYRSVANEYLSEKVGTGKVIRLSPLKEVNQMLIADKVQNRKDFITYHKGTHPRSDELDLYFKEWMERLNVDEEMYEELCAAIDNKKGPVMSREEVLEEKVKVYEQLLHRVQLLSFTGNHELMSRTIKDICDWSYAHRAGNGELDEEEQAEHVRRYFEKLKETVSK